MSIFGTIRNSKVCHLLHPKLSKFTGLARKHSSIFLVQNNLTLNTGVHNLQDYASWGEEVQEGLRFLVVVLDYPYLLYWASRALVTMGYSAIVCVVLDGNF